MESLPLIMVITGAFFLFLFVLGRMFPDRHSELARRREEKAAEKEALLPQVDDAAMMLEAMNRRRRARGLADHTQDAVINDLKRHTANAERSRQEILRQGRQKQDATLDAEIIEVFEATNNARRRKGQPPMTIEEFKASLGA